MEFDTQLLCYIYYMLHYMSMIKIHKHDSLKDTTAASRTQTDKQHLNPGNK